MLSLARTQTHTRAHEQALLRAPEVRSETVGGGVRQHGCTQSWREWLKHTDSICACACLSSHICVREGEKKQNEREKEEKKERAERKGETKELYFGKFGV